MIFNEKQSKLLLAVSSTPQNEWGEDLIIDTQNGEIINTLDCYRFRGKVIGLYKEDTVLLYTSFTLNINTNQLRNFFTQEILNKDELD